MTAADLARLDELRQTCAAPADAFSAGLWCETANEAVLIAVRLASQTETMRKRVLVLRAAAALLRTEGHTREADAVADIATALTAVSADSEARHG